MKAKIYISFKNGILDPQGQTVSNALSSIGMKNIASVKIGKYIEMEFNEVSREEASQITEESCRKLLANPNTETYRYELVD